MMRVVRRGFGLLALVAALTLGAAGAQALPFNFSYTFDSGETLSGMFDGTVQADGDSVIVDELTMAVYSGDPDLEFRQDLLGNLTSFSGSIVEFITAEPTDLLGGFVLFALADVAIVAAADADIVFIETDEYDQARWSLAVKVPEPNSLALFAAAFAAAGLVRSAARRRAGR